MRASLQHVEQKLFLSFFDYMGKKTPRGWAVLVQAVLRASPARARMAQPLGVFLPLQSKNSKVTYSALHVVRKLSCDVHL